MQDQTSAIYGALRSIDGVAIRETGEGEPLALLHGGVGSRNHWGRNVAALRQRFNVITVDLPGFGESADAVACLSTDADAYARAVGRVLAARLGRAPFKAAAFSFGAAVGCAAFASVGLLPTRLALIAPAGFEIDARRELGLERLPRRETASVEAMRGTVARNLGRSMLAVAPDLNDEVVDLHMANLDRTRYDSRLLSMRETLLTDLAKIEGPLLCVWGERDVFPWPSVHERMSVMQRSMPAAKVREIANGGHWVQYECAKPVNELLVAFLEG